MRHLYTTTDRPPRTAKRARQIWDALTLADGAPPRSLSLVVSEGAFRDWMFIRANGELDEFGAGLVGVRIQRVNTPGGLDGYYDAVCATLRERR